MRFISGLMLYLIVTSVNAQIQVQDDLGRSVTLQSPAKRIISLAPHVTELLYAAGASDQVVGVVNYSDYPEQAKRIQQIGSSNKFDMEMIVSANPDLIVAWKSGNPDEQVNELIKLGFAVYYSEPRHLDDVATNIERLGKLLATTVTANKVAEEYTSELNRIRNEYKERKKISVFYQVWNRPILTINGEHLISSVINLCGGENIFSDIKTFVPQVNIESIMDKDPQVIVIGMNKERKDWLDEWQQWKDLSAVKNKHIYPINADLIVRHTPRILIGAGQLCGFLDRLRDL